MSSDRIDFNDLLKWFINLTPEQQLENAEPSNYVESVDKVERKVMSAEDQEFLLSAMDSHVMDEQKRVKLLLKVMRLPQSPHTLHHLQEIEKITKHQQDHPTDSHNAGFDVLNDKHKLRSLLEMRNEDKKRREVGEAILGEEYIPSTFISEYETYKKSTLDTKLAELRHKLHTSGQNAHAQPDQTEDPFNIPAEMLNVDQVDELGEPLSEEQIRRKKAQKRYQYLAQMIEKEIQTTFSSILDRLPPPDQPTLKRIYTKVRDEKLDALEEIEDRTYRGDNAVGFVNYNGIQILKNYLLSQDFELSSLCWRILGNIVANQAFCQNKAVEFGLVRSIIEGLNVSRYLPSIIAHHFFYNALPPYLTRLRAEQSNEEKQQELVEIQRLLLEFAPLCNLTTPRTHVTNLTDAQYNSYLEQLFPTSSTPPSPITLIPILSKYTHFGLTYIKHIMPLLKTMLFFAASLLNNYSTAQTQFLQHNGIISLSYLLELGALHIKSTSPQSQSQPSTQLAPHTSITPPLLQLFDFNESVSNQTIRRVFQVLLGLVDDEYEITTSYELFTALFNQAKTYLHLQGQNPDKIGRSLEFLTLTPLHQAHGAIAGEKNTLIAQIHEDVKNTGTSGPQTPTSTSTSLIEVSDTPPDPQLQSIDNIDEGKPREYFSKPLAPFRLEDSTEIHPSFKLQNNRAGGKINTSGEAVEAQIPLHPVASLLVLFAFPFSMWEGYFNAGSVDRDWVTNSQRVVAFCAKNHYKLKYFTESDPQCISTATNGHNEVKGGVVMPKFATTLHEILIHQARSVAAQKSSQEEKDLKDDQIIGAVIAFIDAYIKGLLAKVQGGTKTQQDQQREFNREELQFLSQIKTGINK